MRKIYKWQEVYWNNKSTLDKYPIGEIVLSGMLENRAKDVQRKNIYYIIKTFVYALLGILNKTRSLKRGRKAIFQIWLNRENDWGLIWPMICEYEQMGELYYIETTEDVFRKHKQELLELRNGKVLDIKKIYNKRIIKLELSDMVNLFAMLMDMRAIIHKYNLGSVWEFISTYITDVGYANGVYNKYYNESKYSISLGTRILGIMYQKYGIYHYAVLHGDEGSENIGYWVPFDRANVYKGLVYGDYYKRLYKKYYNTDCEVIGHPKLSNLNKRFNRESKKIIFFSDSHAIVDDGYVDKENINELNKSLKDISNFVEMVPSKYEFFIKLHPNESGKYIKNFSSSLNGCNLIQGQVSSIDLLKNTLIAISWGSSVNMEAIKCGACAFQLTMDTKLFGKQKFSCQISSMEEVLDYLSDQDKLYELYEKESVIAQEYVESDEAVLHNFIMRELN